MCLVAACWQKLVDQHANSMNPSAVVDLEGSSSLFPVSELFNLLKADDEENTKLKEAEQERQEAKQTKAIVRWGLGAENCWCKQKFNLNEICQYFVNIID